MSERPFLLFVSRDDEGRHVIKVQGDGLPLTERQITLRDALYFAQMFTTAAVEILNEQSPRNRAPDARNS